MRKIGCCDNPKSLKDAMTVPLPKRVNTGGFRIDMALTNDDSSCADPENFSRGGPTLSKIDSVKRITVEVHKYEK